MDEIKIEKNIPLPPAVGRGNRNGKWAFLHVMEIGDSAFVPNTNTNKWRSSTRFMRPVNVKFISRAEGEGVRIWRVE